MLVKRSIVEKWYQTDSWVYKNFSYLFQNSLWSKRIPNGFSVCPYFWMSIFSLLIFRPFFIFPVKYLFIPLINFIGKPAIAVDNFFIKIFKKVLISVPDTRGSGGLLFLLSILILALLTVLGCGIYMSVPKFMETYKLLCETTSGAFSFWSVASFISLFGIIKIHKLITDTECKTMSYIYVWSVLFLIGMLIFIPHDIGSFISAIANFIGVGGAFTWKYLIIGFKYISKWVWIGVSFQPIAYTHLPWWVYIMGLTVFMYMLDKVMVFFEKKGRASLMDGSFDSKAENRIDWINTIYQVMMESKYFKYGKIFVDYDEWGHPEYNGQINSDTFVLESCKAFQHILYKKVIEIIIPNALKELENIPLPSCLNKQLKEIETYGRTEYKIRALFEKNKLSANSIFEFDDYKIKNALISAYNDPGIKSMIDDYAEILRQKHAREEKRKLAIYNGWMHQTCLKVTTAISNLIGRIFRGIKWFFVQAGTLFAYLWMLVKAKKQGACPYFTFTDSSKNVKKPS